MASDCRWNYQINSQMAPSTQEGGAVFNGIARIFLWCCRFWKGTFGDMHHYDEVVGLIMCILLKTVLKCSIINPCITRQRGLGEEQY